jgi:HAE1 family hydrophobic/amphiphilic exporter-1
MSLAKSVVKRPVLWVVVFALITISALYLLTNVAVDMFPNMEMPMLMVSTVYPGADPETVENSVTKMLEGSLVNVSGLKNMTSFSREQFSGVMLEFDVGVNRDAKMNLVRENLDQIRDTLPQNASAPVITLFDFSSDPILYIALRGNDDDSSRDDSSRLSARSQNELRALAKDIVKGRIEQIDGVASGSVEGGQDAIVRVELSQNRLEAYGITISEIAGTLAMQNMELGAGRVSDGAVDYSIRTTGEYTSIADIANTVVAQVGGESGASADIRLQDIGTVALGFQDETAAVYINGEPGVYVAVMKQSGANSVAIADSIYARLPQIKTLLPPDVTIEVTQDGTTQTRAMITELVTSAIVGTVLAMLILLLFLRNINGTIIVGLSIPLSILITLLLMSLAHITLNMMTLTGLILGLGMIVDASIVILESIYKFRERGEKPTVAAVLAGEEVMSSIIASTLTTICVFLPIYLFKNKLDMIGLMIEDMIFTVGISLVSSLFVAIFLVPVLASTWLPLRSRTQKPLKNKVLAGLDRGIGGAIDAVGRGYKRLLLAALHHRLAVIILVIAALAGSLLALTKLPLTLMPSMNEDEIMVNVELPIGTLYEETKAVILQMQEFAIAEINGAKSIIANAGIQSMSYEVEGNNTGGLNIKLGLTKDADSREEAERKIRSHFGDFPNAVMSFSDGDMISSSEIDIMLRVDDMKAGLASAREIVALINAEIPEAIDMQIDASDGLPQVEVQIDRRRAYNMGLNVASIANEIAASMNGITATTFRQSGDEDSPFGEFDVVLLLQEEDRYQIPDLGRIFVRASSGALFPVSNFASFEKTSGPVSINREDQVRVIHITGGVADGYQIGETEAKIAALLADKDLSYSFEGEWGDTQTMMQAFILIITLALLLVFGVMAGQYESFKDPIINFCTIPLMVIGVAAIHIITGQALSMFTMIGLVMLAGIVVNNGIILVDYTNILVRKGMKVREACIEAGAVRFRPVLMTALTTILGLVPMAFFPGASSSMTQPIGLAVIGGLSSATVITLFFIPVMYSLVNARSKVGTHEEN